MIFNRLRSGWETLKKALSSTRSLFGEKLRSLFGKPIDEDTLEKLQTLLYEADLGLATAKELTSKIQAAHLKDPSLTSDDLIEVLKKELIQKFQKRPPRAPLHHPHLILVVGVNGSGKTTSIAKMANLYKKEGKKVLVGAADTFRAGAITQLEVWAERAGVDIVKGSPGGDPAAVAFDTLKAAMARGSDLILLDTAGRLQNKQDLMRELEKIKKCCDKLMPGSPPETLLVLDATAGQNSIDQAKTFHSFTPISGLILTKLDGTAKGGVIVPIQDTLNLPVRYIGVGEGIEDLQVFDPEAFVEALFA
jgi:fused signal recognition particle receptor